METRLRAVRGATTVEADRKELIVAAAKELTQAVMTENGLEVDDIVSVIYTATADLSSEFPAVGGRALGLINTPLICAQEIPVAGSQPRCIRMLVHAYMPVDRRTFPVYLREAVALRPDLQYQSTGGSNHEV